MIILGKPLQRKFVSSYSGHYTINQGLREHRCIRRLVLSKFLQKEVPTDWGKVQGLGYRVYIYIYIYIGSQDPLLTPDVPISIAQDPS